MRISRGTKASRRSGAAFSSAGKKLKTAETSRKPFSPPWLAWLLIFLIASPAIFAPYGQGKGYTPDLHVAAYIQVGATVLLALFFLSSFAVGRFQFVIPSSPILLPVSFFYGWAMLSILWADSKHEALADALEWTGAFLGGMLVLLVLRDAVRMKRLLFCVLLSGFLTSLLVIGQFLFAVDWFQQHTVPAATFGNKNMAAQYIMLVLPVAVAFFLRSRAGWAVWFFAAAASLMAIGVFYTRSRGSLLSLLMEIVVLTGLVIYLKRKYGYRLFRDAPVKRIALAASAVLFLGMSSLTPDVFGNAEEATGNSLSRRPPPLFHEHGGEVLGEVLKYEESAAKRFTIWGNSIPMFKDHFMVGVGLGNWTNHYATYQSWFRVDYSLMDNERHGNAHNDYIEILCELGIIGFFLFIWIIASLLRLMRRLLSDPDGDRFFLAVPLLAAIAGISVNALFSFPLKQPLPILMVLVYSAVLSNLYGAAGKSREYQVLTLSSFPVKAVLTGIAVFAAAGLFDLQRDWYRSKLHYREATLSMADKDYPKAAAEAELARGLNPLSAAPLQLKAKALLLGGRRSSYESAVETLEKAARMYPDSVETLTNLSAGYYLVGRLEDMTKNFRRLSELQPVDFEVKYKYAFSLLEAGEFEEALKVFGVYRRYLQLAYEKRGLELRLETDEAMLELLEKRRRKKAAQLSEMDEALGQAKRGIRGRVLPDGGVSGRSP